MPDISPQLREAAKAIFSGQDKDHPPCRDCGGVHARACPRVQSERVVFNATGGITERHVTYFPPDTWEHIGILWPEDIYDDDDTSSGD